MTSNVLSAALTASSLSRARVESEGQKADDIPVTLQLEHGSGDRWGHASMDVVWDNNTQATGCVIVADLEG